MVPPDVARLVRAGNRFRSRGDARKAEPLLRRAVVVAKARQRVHGYEHDLPFALNALGVLCKDLGRYDEARALYERALAVLDRSPTPDGHGVATLYHNLGGIEHARRDFPAAESLARRGLALRRNLGDDDEALATDLVALAAILDGQRRYDEAEAMYVEALAILERDPKPNAGDVAVALNNLGAQYLERGRMAEALELLVRAERLKRELLGDQHPDLAVTLNNLAEARKRRGELGTAESLYGEAIELLDGALGVDHPKAVACRRNLSILEKSVVSDHNTGRSEREMIRIDLTAEQKQLVKAATSRDAEAIELTVGELEQRIAPFFRLALNHNETFLAADEAPHDSP